MRLVRVVMSFMLALGLAGCAQDDDARVLGHWRAERFKLMSLNVPISPEFVISKDELVAVGTDLHVPIASISHNGDEVTLNTTSGLGLSFYFESRDRMYFDVPLLGKIYYQRVKQVPHEARTADLSAVASSAAISAGAQVLASAVPAMAALLEADGAGQVSTTQSRAKPEHAQTAVSNVEEHAAAAAVSAPGSGNLNLHRLVRAAEHEMDQGNLDAAQRMLMEARRIDDTHPMVDYNLAILRTKQGDSEAAIHHLKDAFSHGFRAFVLLEANPDLAALRSDARYNVLVARYK